MPLVLVKTFENVDMTRFTYFMQVFEWYSAIALSMMFLSLLLYEFDMMYGTCQQQNIKVSVN